MTRRSAAKAPRRHRPPTSPGVVVALANDIEYRARQAYEAHAPQAPVDGSWTPGFRLAAPQKLVVLVASLSAALGTLNPAWTADVALAAEPGGRGVLTFATPHAERDVNIMVEPRTVSIGDVRIALRSPHAGEMIVGELVNQAARFVISQPGLPS